MSPDSPDKQALLANLPSVDEVLKSLSGLDVLDQFPRSIIVQSIREVISVKRKLLLEGFAPDCSPGFLVKEIQEQALRLSAYSLVPVINATGIVIHTNLGRSILSEKILKNVLDVSQGYSNLEYNLESGKRGQRHIHTQRLLKDITGAEDALIVNNNAAAVLLCLNTMAKAREVIVSRGELVEIGGSFRVPDVMSASSACLREVGTTNKTHLHDYARAINEHTALLLKVHQSNYRIIGFTSEVEIDDLVSLGKQHMLPVMYDLGSGCLLDLKPYGIYSEPSVQEIARKGVDLITFSGDKLLGGPQGGIIIGKKTYVEKIRKNPLARALRVDKLTIAAFEATLLQYLDPLEAIRNIPTLSMLLQRPEEIKNRARKIAAALQKKGARGTIKVVQDSSQAGGGSLPEMEFPTFAVTVLPQTMSVNELETLLRRGSPPIIARIKENALILDARTIRDRDIGVVAARLSAALSRVD